MNPLLSLGTIALLGLATTYLQMGRLEEAVALQREVGDRWFIANALNNLGAAAKGLGDLEAARQHHQDNLELCAQMGDRAGMAYAALASGMTLANAPVIE